MHPSLFLPFSSVSCQTLILTSSLSLHLFLFISSSPSLSLHLVLSFSFSPSPFLHLLSHLFPYFLSHLGEPRVANITALTNVILMALDRQSFTSLLGPLKEVLNQNMILRVINILKWFENLSNNMKLRIARAFVLETFEAGILIYFISFHFMIFYVKLLPLIFL